VNPTYCSPKAKHCKSYYTFLAAFIPVLTVGVRTQQDDVEYVTHYYPFFFYASEANPTGTVYRRQI